MKQKILSLILIFTLISGVMLSTGLSLPSVAVKNEAGETLKNYYSSDDITNALSAALDYAKRNSAKDNFLTIEIKKGKYNVTKTLHLTSYITIDMGNSKLINANKLRGNIFKSPEDKEYKGYSSLEQVVLKNGTLDSKFNHNSSCVLRLCHSKNIVIENVRFLNNYYSHHFELAACKNVTVRDCVFKGQVSDLNVNSSEAIQLDILDKIHFYGFTGYDNTMNDSILIENTLFENVYRGVGTHNFFKDLYQTDITIRGCKFKNITDCAISAVNFKDTHYSNNTFDNCKYPVFIRRNGK